MIRSKKLSLKKSTLWHLNSKTMHQVLGGCPSNDDGGGISFRATRCPQCPDEDYTVTKKGMTR